MSSGATATNDLVVAAKAALANALTEQKGVVDTWGKEVCVANGACLNQKVSNSVSQRL